MTHVSTHVLNAVTGRPAAGIAVTLTDTAGALLAQSVTDTDGRIASLAGNSDLGGVYRITFDTRTYFASQGIAGFYPEVIIAFEIDDPAGRYHVPVLLSPFSYSTYRGS